MLHGKSSSIKDEQRNDLRKRRSRCIRNTQCKYLVMKQKLHPIHTPLQPPGHGERSQCGNLATGNANENVYLSVGSFIHSSALQVYAPRCSLRRNPRNHESREACSNRKTTPALRFRRQMPRCLPGVGVDSDLLVRIFRDMDRVHHRLENGQQTLDAHFEAIFPSKLHTSCKISGEPARACSGTGDRRAARIPACGSVLVEASNRYGHMLADVACFSFLSSQVMFFFRTRLRMYRLRFSFGASCLCRHTQAYYTTSDVVDFETAAQF